MPIAEKQVVWTPKRTKSEFLEHFISFPTANGAIGGALNLVVNLSSGVLSLANSDATHPGTATMSTSTSATGRCGLSTNMSAFLPGSIAFEYECAFKFPALSNTTDQYAAFLGFSDINSSATPSSNGLGLYYTQGQANLTPYSKKAGTVSSATGIAADTNWHIFNMKLNKAGTTATFTFDGGTAQTMTTNLPVTAMGLNQVISKIAGTTATTLLLDYIYLKLDAS